MADAQRSWQRFITGLLIFLLGVILLFAVSSLHVIAYGASLFVLILGFALAMWGYAGIFVSRFQFMKKPGAYSKQKSKRSD